jgi:hypothetical protein
VATKLRWMGLEKELLELPGKLAVSSMEFNSTYRLDQSIIQKLYYLSRNLPTDKKSSFWLSYF